MCSMHTQTAKTAKPSVNPTKPIFSDGTSVPRTRTTKSCRTTAERNQFVATSTSKWTSKTKKVLEFQSSLAGYGIIDAGEYIEQVSEDNNGTLLETELLEAVKDQIAMQKMDIASNPEYCPDPGTQTLFDIQTKIENGLYYTKIAISCNVSHLPGYASHMTNIEVVEDKDFKKLDEGVPVLATMEVPKRNTMFIEDMEAKKQSGVDPMAPGLFISLVPAMWIVLKYGYMGDN